MTSKIQKYTIHSDRQGESTGPWAWWARVPYGSFKRFNTWTEAAGYLRLRHALREDGKR